jgi:Alpha-1,3-glucanase catalytic domain D1/Carbohydrate binding module (family 6)/F5/8 type C domain/Fibronectin type III domain
LHLKLMVVLFWSKSHKHLLSSPTSGSKHSSNNLFMRFSRKTSIGLLGYLWLIPVLVCSRFQTAAQPAVGAVTPFFSLEAEAGTLGGGATIVALTSPPTTPYSSPQLEASGHSYVQLTGTGQYVEWTNNTGQNITAIDLRSCIPDAPGGGGITSALDLYINAVFRQAFSVHSQQNYCYEGTNYNGQVDKNPADGNPRGFWNDTHAFITGAAVAPGQRIRFQMDPSNTAAFYYIDVVDLENPPPPLAQPANSLSIVSYGALSNNPAVDNTTSMNHCFSAAQAQGKIAWIPPGTFYISAIHGGLRASGIGIAGAGPWYSTIYRLTPTNNTQGVANIINAVSCSLSNVLLDCNGSSRAGNNNNGAIDFSGNNWVVDNVWIQHVTSSFWCAGVGGIARNCRTLSVWSDGGNFNNVQSANGIGVNLTYSNNFVRGTGDDAMAINSVNDNVFGSTTYFYTPMSNIVYANNTAIGAWGGKGIGIYGGVNEIVTNNLLCDTARYIGLGVGRFGVNGSDLLSATVTGNTVLRCGGNGYSQQQPALVIGNSGDGQSVGTVATVYCASNLILDSLYSGVGLSTSSNIVFQNNAILDPGLDGIVVGPPFVGTTFFGNAIVYSNTVTGLSPGMVALTNDTLGYAAITPIAAANYDNASEVTLGPCADGGQSISPAQSGAWTAYNNVDLDRIDTFVARVAAAGTAGAIEVRLDSPAGALIGTCAVPATGDAQIYANAYANLSPTNGTHTVYLLYSLAPGPQFGLEYFGFFTASPGLSHKLVPSDTYSLKAVVNGEYVTAPNNGSNALIASSATVGTAEQFQVIDAGGGNIAFRALINSNIVTAENAGNSPLIANRTAVGQWETFAQVDAGNGNIALLAMANTRFVTAPDGGASPLLAQSTSLGAAQAFTVALVSGVPPAAPANLTAAPGNSQASLNWIPSAGAVSYNLEYSLTSGGPYTTITTNIAGTSFTCSGLTNGTTYYFVVAAANPVAVSPVSSEVSVVPGTLNRLFWIASSSTTGSDSPANALDGNLATRWSTGTSQVPGQWFQVDMAAPALLNKLVLNCINSANDYPRGYQVNFSFDGIHWGTPIATGTGTYGVTTITFAPRVARFVRITQTGTVNGTFWSIDEFNVFGTPVSATPFVLGFNLAGQQAQISWPEDHTGWTLEVQTNSDNAGLGTNWVRSAASQTTNQVFLPVDSSKGSLFFRLIFP